MNHYVAFWKIRIAIEIGKNIEPYDWLNS